MRVRESMRERKACVCEEARDLTKHSTTYSTSRQEAVAHQLRSQVGELANASSHARSQLGHDFRCPELLQVHLQALFAGPPAAPTSELKILRLAEQVSGAASAKRRGRDPDHVAHGKAEGAEDGIESDFEPRSGVSLVSTTTEEELMPRLGPPV